MNRSAMVHCLDEPANGIDENVFVPDRREAQDTWGDGYFDTIVLVVSDLGDFSPS